MFPTDGLREPLPDPEKSALPDIRRLKDELGPEIFEQLEQLLLEYEDVFQKHKADSGRCTVIEHKIDLELGLCHGAQDFAA